MLAVSFVEFRNSNVGTQESGCWVESQKIDSASGSVCNDCDDAGGGGLTGLKE